LDVEKEIKELKEQKIEPIPAENNTQGQVSQENAAKTTQLTALKNEFYTHFNQMNKKIGDAEQKDRELLSLIDEKKKVEEEYNLSFNPSLISKIEELESKCENNRKEIVALTAEINETRDNGEKIRNQYKKIKESLTKQS